MDVWIEEARKVKDAMVCSLVFGSDGVKLLTVKDTWVRMKKDGSGLWFKCPEKPRMRDGQPVIDDKGYPVRDELVTIYLDPVEKKPTKAAFGLKDQILAAIQETWDGLTSGAQGVGSAARAPLRTAPAPAGVRPGAKAQRPAGMGAARAPQVLADVNEDDEDDLPF